MVNQWRGQGVGTLVERFLRHQRQQGNSRHTLEWYRHGLGQFVAFLGSGEAERAMDADALREFIDHLRGSGHAHATVVSRTRAIKAWGNWLVEEEYVAKSPFVKVKRPGSDERVKDLLTPVEVGKVLDGCDRSTLLGLRDYAIIALLYSTGLRCAEVCGLATNDVDRAQQLLRIKRGKGGKFRQVPMSRTVERAIDKYRDRLPADAGLWLFLSRYGGPLTTSTLQRTMERRGEEVGVHANPHKFRHSCAVQYLRNGGKVEVLRQMLGHTNIAMTLAYARIAGVDVVRGHDTADPLNALKGAR